MSVPRLLTFTSCQAENPEFIGRALARYIGESVGLSTDLVNYEPIRRMMRTASGVRL